MTTETSQPDPYRPETAPPMEELVARTVGLQPWRRVFHALNGILLAFLPVLFGWPRWLTVTVLAIAFVGLYLLDWLRLRTQWLNRIFFRILQPLASPREAAGIASSTWYALGAMLVWAMFSQPIATASILVLGLADPAAGVVGRLYGRHPLGKGSIEGTTTFFVVAAVTLGLLVGWPAALVAAAAGAVVEIIPGMIDDNLVVPVTVGGVLWLMI